jgi:hypothetical protein
VVCVCNEDYPASLELRKIYERIPDRRAESHQLIPVVDEEDEALYLTSYFMPVDLPMDVQEAIESAAEFELHNR